MNTNAMTRVTKFFFEIFELIKYFQDQVTVCDLFSPVHELIF